MIPHSRPSLGLEEEEAACRVIRSGQLAQGPEVAAFEEELADVLGGVHVVAVSSGSAALHLGLIALDIGPKDEVIMPSYVCTALLHATSHVGARAVLVDIDSDTLGLNPDHVRSGPNTRAVIVPHMFGRSARLDALAEAGLSIVEDCAMALGATWKGKPLGSLGKIGIFSFYATKVLCAGEGGAVATPDPDIAGRIRDLRDYDGRTDARPRFNYKMTDLQAAIGRVQLGKLSVLIARRREMGDRYAQALAHTGALLPDFPTGAFPFRYVIQHAKGAEQLLAQFEARGVAARNPVFCPLHRCLNLLNQDFPQTEVAFRDALSLPLYPALTEPEIEHILRTAREIL